MYNAERRFESSQQANHFLLISPLNEAEIHKTIAPMQIGSNRLDSSFSSNPIPYETQSNLEIIKFLNDYYILSIAEVTYEGLKHQFPVARFLSLYPKMSNRKREIAEKLFKSGPKYLGYAGYACDAFVTVKEALKDQPSDDIGNILILAGDTAVELGARWYAEAATYDFMAWGFATVLGISSPVLIIASATLTTALISHYGWDYCWNGIKTLCGQIIPECYAASDVPLLKGDVSNRFLSTSPATDVSVVANSTTLNTLFSNVRSFNLIGPSKPLFTIGQKETLPFLFSFPNGMQPFIIQHEIPMNDAPEVKFPAVASLMTTPSVSKSPAETIRIHFHSARIDYSKFIRIEPPREPKGNLSLWTDGQGKLRYQVTVSDPLLASLLVAGVFLKEQISWLRLSEKERSEATVQSCLKKLRTAQSKNWSHPNNISLKSWKNLEKQRLKELRGALVNLVKTHSDAKEMQFDARAMIYAIDHKKNDLQKEWPGNLKKTREAYLDYYGRLYNQFNELHQKGSPQAKAIAEKLVSKFPDFPSPYLALAQVLEKENPALAKQMADKAVSVAELLNAKQNADVMPEGVVDFSLIRKDSAKGCFFVDKTFPFRVQQLAIYRRIFDKADELNKSSHAQDLINLASNFDVSHPFAQDCLVTVFFHQKELDKAIEHQKNLCQAQDIPDNYFQLAALYLKNNNEIATVETLEKFITKASIGQYLSTEKNKKRLFQAHISSAELLKHRELAENKLKIIAHLEKATALDPTYTEGWKQLGYFCMESDPEKSISHFKTYLSLKADDYEAKIGLMSAYYSHGDYDAALREAQEVQNLNSKDHRGYLVAGLCYLQEGEMEKAKACLQQCCEVNRDDEDAKKILKSINKQEKQLKEQEYQLKKQQVIMLASFAVQLMEIGFALGKIWKYERLMNSQPHIRIFLPVPDTKPFRKASELAFFPNRVYQKNPKQPKQQTSKFQSKSTFSSAFFGPAENEKSSSSAGADLLKAATKIPMLAYRKSNHSTFS